MPSKRISLLKGKVIVTVHPTESTEKVITAVRNILGDIQFERRNEGEEIILEGDFNGDKTLTILRNSLARNRIRNSAKAFLSQASNDKILSFGLNKQAAFVDRVSFYSRSGSPLGPIQITLKGDTAEAIEYLCK